MAGVEAHAKPRVPVRFREDGGQVLEPGANRRPLAGGLLEQHHRASAGAVRQQFDQRLGDQARSVGFGPLRVAAGMQDDTEEAERLGAVHLVPHRLDRLPAQRRVRRRQVDQVARVRDDRTDARRLHPARGIANLLRRHDAAAPLVRVLRENLKRVATMRDRALDRQRQPAGDGHVGAEQGTHGKFKVQSLKVKVKLKV